MTWTRKWLVAACIAAAGYGCSSAANHPALYEKRCTGGTIVISTHYHLWAPVGPNDEWPALDDPAWQSSQAPC